MSRARGERELECHRSPNERFELSRRQVTLVVIRTINRVVHTVTLRVDGRAAQNIARALRVDNVYRNELRG